MAKHSAIFDLWGNEIGISDMRGQSAEYDKATSEVVERERLLLEQLKDSPDLLTAYENMDKAVQNLHYEEAKIMYRFGVRYGFSLAMDVFDVNNQE